MPCSKKDFISSLRNLKNQIYHQRRVKENISPINLNSRRLELLRKIQEVVLELVKTVASPSGVPSLMVKPRRIQWKNCHFDKKLSLKPRNLITYQEIKYTTNKRRFDMIFNLLSKIYRLLQSESLVTKRELYYEQTELFGNQRALNEALSDVCSLLEASPWELRVFPTSKGLVAGDLTIITADGEVIDCCKPGGVLVPQDVKGIKQIKTSANFILVVEKDAAFQKLLDDGAHVKFAPGIIITGKGEPDTNTRMLVSRLSRDLAIPVLILVDANPYGIEIMCTYRFGSLALSQYSDELAATEIRWIGIHPTDIEKLIIPTVPFTANDFAKARDLCSRPYLRSNKQLFEQVNCLLESGRKCEIENLTALSTSFLTDMFLPYKITSHAAI